VVTIVALIVAGLAVLVFHVGSFGATASFSNLWTHGGFLPFGILGVLLTMQIVMFAYTGVELIGVTAGEAQDPQRALPRATNGVIARILIFYLGALIVIMAVVPWDQLSPSVSPFVYVFEKLGVPGAAGIITLVVITAAASSCNSGLFSTGRMLWSLAQRGQAPRPFAALNAHHVPAAGIHVSAAVMLLTVVLNYAAPRQVFIWVTSIALIGALWTWGIILVSHRNYRRAVRAGRAKAATFRMPGAPVANWVVLAFLVMVTVLLAWDDDTRVALYVAPVWFGLLAVGYFRLKKPSQ
jgi:amino acid transporter, AAT family